MPHTALFHLRFWICLSLLIALPAAAAPAAPTLQPGHFEMPSWFKSSFLDLPAETAEISSHGKRLMLMFHQNGCPYCAKLVNDNFSQPDLVTYFQAHFEAIDINLWGDREVTDFDGNSLTEKEFSLKYKVWATPTLLFFNEQGKTVLRLDGYYDPARLQVALRYVAEKQEDKQTFAAYHGSVASSNTGVWQADPGFAKPPYNLAVDAGKRPIAVFFEEKNCVACQQLREAMRQHSETLAMLNQFYLVQLDRRAETPLITPAGQKTTAKAWADSLNVSYLPGLLLFSDGQPVMQIDAQFQAFHLKNLLEYVASGAFRKEPNFQRYLHDKLSHQSAQP